MVADVGGWVMMGFSRLNIEREWEHYRRLLSGNAPVETRAEYREDRIHAMHYNAHNGRFITGAIFLKGDKSGKGSVFLGMMGPKRIERPESDAP